MVARLVEPLLYNGGIVSSVIDPTKERLVDAADALEISSLLKPADALEISSLLKPADALEISSLLKHPYVFVVWKFDGEVQVQGLILSLKHRTKLLIGLAVISEP